MKCRNCKQQHKPYSSLDNWCKEIDCQTAKAMFNLDKQKKAKQKEWKAEKKVLKESLKTKSDYLKETQIVFNKYIRLRDEGNPCISCDAIMTKKINASHYFNANNHHNVRFNEDNVHSSCEYCNQFLSGNLIEYRPRLINKIGIDRFNLLESIARKEAHYSIPELIEMKVTFKEKIRTLNK